MKDIAVSPTFRATASTCRKHVAGQMARKIFASYYLFVAVKKLPRATNQGEAYCLERHPPIMLPRHKRAGAQRPLQRSQPWLTATFTSAAVFLAPVFSMMFWRCDSTVRGLV